MTGNCNRWLVALAAANLALQGTNFGTFWKSATYVAIVLLLPFVLRDAHARAELAVPRPPRAVVIPLVFWLAWTGLTWFWSIDPNYTRAELKGELLDLSFFIALFYVVPYTAQAWRTVVGSSLFAFAVLGVLALGLALSPWGWNADRFHGGIGPYSTYLVQTAPLLLWFIVPAPEGFGGRLRTWLAMGGMMVVLIADARLTSNRIVWFALLLVILLVPVLCALRWQARARMEGWRWIVPIAGVAVLLAVGFTDTLVKRTELNYSPSTPVTEALAEDPRFALWSHTWDKIVERPLIGYGAGKKILAPELRRELGDPLLTHAHNVFISQWLQKGAIGLAAFAALLLGLLLQFVRFYRSRDDVLALIGITGMAILTAMIVKNLTDDFLYGAYGRQFLCFMAVLIGYGMRRERDVAAAAQEIAQMALVGTRPASTASRAAAPVASAKQEVST